MLNQYLHIQCDDYALLSAIEPVEQVIAGRWGKEAQTVDYHGQSVASLNLLQRLTDNDQAISRHCIIMRDEQSDARLAVLVGKVNRVQVIDDKEFCDLPNLDFPFNAYFDKVYMQETDKRCIYRLKSLFTIGINNDN